MQIVRRVALPSFAMAGLRCYVMAMVAIVVCAAPSMADQAIMASDSPFGIVCPCPGIQELGIQWCRGGAGATNFVNWPEIQKSPDTWDWTAADNDLKQLEDFYKLSPLPILGYTPKWASRKPAAAAFFYYPPRDVADFSRFVRQCVARYKHKVKIWEVWNEPDGDFLKGSIADYAEMVKAAAVAAKQEDPDCRIAMGCTGVNIAYLERLYEFGCGPYFDVMSVHPYQWGRGLNDGWMIDKLESCRQLMDRHGDAHKEIWVTELGWSLADGILPQDQANLLAQAMVTVLSVRERLKVEKVFWFSAKDWGGPGFGLFDVAGKPKPASLAYRAVTTELAGAHYRGSWKAPEGVRGHVFDCAGEPVLVVWTPSPDGKARIELKTSAPKLSLRTVANQAVEVATKEAKAAIDVTHAPVFITGLKTTELEPGPAPQPPASPPPAAKQPLSGVWLSVLPPPTTARPTMLLNGSNELPVRVHNNGSGAAHGELQLKLTSEKGNVLATGGVPFDLTPGTTQTVIWRTMLPASNKLVGQLANLQIRGLAGKEPLTPMDVPVRLVHSEAIEFTANSWVEQQYLHKAEKSGCADSIRFGNEFGYRFDLRNARLAQLRINLGAHAAKPWKLLVSKDDKAYALERSGASCPTWQTLALDKYLASPREPASLIYVKIQGEGCQVREIVLEMTAEDNVKPAK